MIWDYLKRLIKPKPAPKPRPVKEGQRVLCNYCGYEGDISRFLDEDMWDTVCPKCGEKDDHTYEL